MADKMMTLRRLVKKGAAADLLREMIGFAAERLVQRNGCRDQDLKQVLCCDLEFLPNIIIG